MRYQVFSCVRTKQLADEEPRAFVPLERYREGGVTKTRAVMPGYIFFPDDAPPRITQRLSLLYALRPMTRGSETCHVSRQELVKMQEALNAEFEGATRIKVYDFEPGECLSLLLDETASGFEVEFARYKGGGRGRVYFNGRHIDVPLSSLRRREEKG